MSLLTQPYATPSRVKGVAQFLMRTRGQRVKRETAEQLLAPTPLQSDVDEKQQSKRPMVRAVVAECLKLGLIVEEDGYLLPSAALAAMNREAGTDTLPEVILGLLLAPEHAENDDLLAALAWFLGQDPYDAPGTWNAFAAKSRESGADDILQFNDNNFNMLWHWSRYLGFARLIVLPDASGRDLQPRLMPDPTVYLRRMLPAVLGTNSAQPIPIVECLTRLADQMPLFEGGVIRERMDRYSPTRESTHLSKSTSLALLQLEDQGRLKLEMQSDARAMVLMDGTSVRAVSSVILNDSHQVAA